MHGPEGSYKIGFVTFCRVCRERGGRSIKEAASGVMLLLIPAPMIYVSTMVASLPLPLPSLVSQDARVPTIIAATTLRGRQALRRDI